MAQLLLATTESTSRTQTQTFTIPGLIKLNSASVNTGSVEVISVVGDKVTIRASNGAYTSRPQTGGSAAGSRTQTGTQTAQHQYRFTCLNGPPSTRYDNAYYPPLPSTMEYNSGGYSGTLSKISTSYTGDLSGQACSPAYSTNTQTLVATGSYSGTVSKPDTRTYTSYYQYNVTFNYETNAVPTLSLSTTDNRTLYENDTFGISGSATDTDIGNVVSVKYQLNGGAERAITSGISTGVAIPFNRTLTYKGGMLYDGANAVTPALAESTTHSLKVWAEDDKGGKSTEQTRLFTVVANRPATLTIEPFVTTGNLIDSDTMTIKGNVVDPENNTVIVRYKIGSGSYAEVHNGGNGPFSIPIKLTALKVGANTVSIQATDSYGAVSSKTLNIAKSGNVSPLKTSVTRYKINPPNGTAKGILLWVEREVGDLIVDAEISATMAGEAESFVPMTKTSTAFVTDGIEEDEFTHDAGTPKDNIVVKLTMTRSSTATNNGIKLISGVLS